MDKKVKEVKTRKPYQRSSSYPPTSLKEALDFATLIDKLGENNVAEKIILKTLNIANPNTQSFYRKTSAAKQFELLTVDNKSYSLTDRAKHILRPIDKASRDNLLVEAFLSPELYKTFYEKFRGKKIPETSIVANIFNHQFNIITNVSMGAAEAFIESAEFVGLLDDNHVLKDKDTVAKPSPVPLDKTIFEQFFSPSIPQAPSTPSIELYTTTVEISKGLVTITVPKGGITREDKERLLKTLDASLIVKE